jgi:thiosulfate/3-mercaptopyruvate sulfurtransferase
MADDDVDHPELVLPGPLVDAGWLSTRLGAPGLVVADVRWYLDGRSGRAAWEVGHIPGAVWIDLDGDLAGSPGGHAGRHPLPAPEVFAAAMERAGIGDDTTVVAYDDTGGMTAARLWWMLHVLGRSVAVLDGGLASWTGSLERADRSSTPPVRAASFSPCPWPCERVVDIPGVVERAPGVVVIDARSPERFRGEPNPIDNRLGHVPGARNVPWASNLDPATGRFRSRGELRAHYESLGIAEGSPVIASCGSGVSACADLLGLELAGLGAASRLFPASWSGWTAHGDLPIETGPDSDVDRPSPSP